MGIVLHQECGNETDRESAAGKESGQSDGKLLQKQRQQRANESKQNCESELKQSAWFMHDVRRQLYACGKTDRGYAKPEELPSEKQDNGANACADYGNGEMFFHLRNVEA